VERSGKGLFSWIAGAGTTVIRKDFAKALGLQGRSERIDLAVVGGERVQQKARRRLKFRISPLDKEEEFTILTA